SLEGAAVTSIRVSDLYHEFSDIPGIREDMTQLLLQIKQLRLKLHEGDSARLRLDVRGEGTVTAADIICPGEVEIVNPDLYLFTVDDEKTRLEMEMTVQRGRGYSPAEERGRLPIGELPVDAIYSPSKRVNFNVERARIGQNTGFDKLVMEIWTDGTIAPEEALSTSAAILMQHLRQIAGVTEESLMVAEPEEPEPSIPSEIYETPIEQLDLSVRVFNSLKRTGITTVGEVLDHLARGQDAMLAIRNFGEKSLDELRDKLGEKGYLKGDEAGPEGEAVAPETQSS
ncbi:MAG: DNA-directed RNA polymerase subunit alpha, partial [Anaerolineales bacterium]